MANENAVFSEYPSVESENDVLLQGTIVHKFIAPKVAILTINTGRATQVVNYPNVLFFGDLRTNVVANYEIGDHVTIRGNIQSSRKNENIKNQILQSVIAESIDFTENVMKKEFGIYAPSSHKDFENKFKIKGRVVYIDSPAAGVVRLTVRTFKKGHVSFGHYVYYAANADAVLRDIHVNDIICALGNVQTNKVEKDNETKYYQDYILFEVGKA